MTGVKRRSILRGVDLTEHLILANGLGVVGVPLPACYTYVIHCGDGLVVIDPGLPDTHKRVMDNLERRGMAELPVHAVFLTHGHGDHALAAGPWALRGAPVYASAFTADQLNNDLIMAFKENPDYVRYSTTYFPELLPVADGAVMSFGNVNLEVLSTPGHSPGCLTFSAEIDNRHALFVGDLIFPDGSVGHLGAKSFRPPQLLHSLERIAAREVDILCGGHWYKTSRTAGRIKRVLRRAREAIAESGQDVKPTS